MRIILLNIALGALVIGIFLTWCWLVGRVLYPDPPSLYKFAHRQSTRVGLGFLFSGCVFCILLFFYCIGTLLKRLF